MPSAAGFDKTRLARLDAFVKERYLDSGLLPIDEAGAVSE